MTKPKEKRRSGLHTNLVNQPENSENCKLPNEGAFDNSENILFRPSLFLGAVVIFTTNQKSYTAVRCHKGQGHRGQKGRFAKSVALGHRGH